MAIGIATNYNSLNAANQLGKTQSMAATAMERLSSGNRINSAKDDAAGLAVASKMDTQVRGLNMAIRNANDGISLGQTAESYLGSMQESMQRMRELSVQAANGALTDADRGQLDLEYQQLGSEINRTIAGAKYNDVNLFQGGAAIDIQVGKDVGDTITIAASAISAPITFGSIGTAANANTEIAALDTQLESVVSERSKFGAVQSRFETVISNLSDAVVNLSAAKGRIMDTDFAAETMTMTKSQILQQAGTAMLAQANQQPNNVLSLLR